MTALQPEDPSTPTAAVVAADLVVADLVRAACAAKERARVTDAPAGAGKTEAVVRLVGALATQGRSVGLVTQTNEQAFDLLVRLSNACPDFTISFMPASDIRLPPRALRANVATVEAKEAAQRSIVVATADKWSHCIGKIDPGAFRIGIVDEAYQISSAKLLRVADFFGTLDLIGDPGQLDPFATIDDAPWAGHRTNPVTNAVTAFLSYHPSTPRRSLPVTRRLAPSAATLIQQAFYPALRFGPATRPGDRKLVFTAAPTHCGQAMPAGDAWAMAVETGWAYVELCEKASLQTDSEIAMTLAELTSALFARRPVVFDEHTGPEGRLLTHQRVAIGVVHRSQRRAIAVALEQRGLSEVVVDTANRLQGREFDVTLVWHPLAGRTDATAFHLDAGRMCVLTTRHRQACVVVGRAGTERLLAQHPPKGDIRLGVEGDAEFDGWEAHVKLLEHLATVKV